MKDNGKTSIIWTVDEKIIKAELLIKQGGKENIIKAWDILLALKQQKKSLRKSQTRKINKLMEPISDKKNREIEKSLEKLKRGIIEQNTVYQTEALYELRDKQRFLSIEHNRRLAVLKEKIYEKINRKDVGTEGKNRKKEEGKLSEAAKVLTNAQKLISKGEYEEAKKILSLALNGILSRAERAKILRLLDEIAIRSNGRKTKNRMR